MEECPNCSLEFETERGVKIHHSHVHRVSLDRFEEDREWVHNEMMDAPIEKVSIDQMMTHLTHRIELQQSKHDLRAGQDIISYE